MAVASSMRRMLISESSFKSQRFNTALSVAFPLERYSDAAAASARQALDEARRQIERMLCSVELQF